MKRSPIFLRPALASALVLPFLFVSAALASPESALIDLGERLFQDGRFSQPYAKALQEGRSDEGQLMSCATCHHLPDQGRGYADSETRSPVPLREDGLRVTLRNSPALIDLFYNETPTQPHLLHYDGEFETPEALVMAGLTGRNSGWLDHEKSAAVAHAGRIIRAFYGSELSLLGLDGTPMGDTALLEGVGRAVSAYMRSLEFSKNPSGVFDGSPYDRFLAENGLPQLPAAGESPAAYTLRLLESTERLTSPRWIDDGPMKRHVQDFRFGPVELQGMKVFLKSGPRGTIRDLAHLRGIGNCASCHAPPAFTDFTLRNTGVSQEEYDAVHGRDAFLRMRIPTLADRMKMPRELQAGFAAIPSLVDSSRADLGAWNQLRPGVRNPLFSWLCGTLPGCEVHSESADAQVEEAAIGAFKTPTVRNLGHSAPYLHNGSRPTLEGTVRFYFLMSMLARDDRLRSIDPEMKRIFLDGRDLVPLVSFMKALNEEYE